MGSLFSKPKIPPAPAMPTVIETPAPVLENVSNAGNTGSGGDNADDAPEVTPEEQRVKNILTRNRGRIGTITTSFNGVLSNAVSTVPPRKTLLGE